MNRNRARPFYTGFRTPPSSAAEASTQLASTATVNTRAKLRFRNIRGTTLAVNAKRPRRAWQAANFSSSGRRPPEP